MSLRGSISAVTLGRYILGCAELVITVGSLAWGANCLHGLFFPHLRGAAALLGGTILTLAGLTVLSELLGTIGALNAAGLIIASVAAGVAATVVSQRRGVMVRAWHWRRRELSTAAVLAAAVGLITFEQVPHTLSALRGGISEFDSLTYHLPMAARWVQTSSMSAIHQIYPGSLFAYYPYNAELLHAVGMVTFGSDLLSPVLNLFFVALTLLAAWCIGEARGAGISAVAAVTAILTTWGFYLLGGGTALNDLPSLAFVLAAIALVAHSDDRRYEQLLAAIAGGLAIGTKPDTAVVVVLLALAMIWRSSRPGLRTFIWLAGLLLGGGYWYVRDAVWVGNPSPGLSLGFLPSPHAFPWPLTFAGALGRGTDDFASLTDGIHAVLGPSALLICPMMLLGFVAGLWPGRFRWEKAAALGGIASVLLWPFSPFTQVVLFSVRYAAPAIAIGMILLVTVPRLSAGRAPLVVAMFLLAISVWNVANLHPGSIPYPAPALVAAFTAGAVVLCLARIRVAHTPAIAAGLLALLVLVGAGWPVAHGYLIRRYRLSHFVYSGPAGTALRRLFSWSQNLHHQRLGLEGGELQYPLYGSDLSNYVQYIGETQRNGGFARVNSCREWREAINMGRYSYVMTVPWGSESNSPPVPSPEASWTSSDPAASVVLQPGSGITVFAIRAPMHSALC